VLKKVMEAYQGIVYSRYAEQLARAAGLDVRYVPHGVDTALFRPMDVKAARAATRLPADRYIVGMVAANKGTPSRKALPQSLEAFKLFQARHPDALLYLHTHKGPEQGGVNLPELAQLLGLVEGKDVIFAEPYNLLMGFPEEAMAVLYNSFDVLLAASMGEGFGIPILEAQACGTPVLTGDWTSMTELTWKGAMVPADCAERYYTPLAAWQYLPRIGALAEALETAYRGSYVRKPPDEVRGYAADHVTEHYWRPVLDELAARIEAEKAPVAA
jgi:glycosyltransferase involved in cell wall biosynthesis